MAKSPNKKELAQIKVLSDMGESSRAIGERLGRSHKTVQKYLERTDIYDDPQMQTLVGKIKTRETDDLYLIGAKARNRLHDILDEGKTRAIETTAIMDRAFQQRRLLENQSTGNFNIQAYAVKLDQEIKNLNAELKALEAEGQ
jgi:IS30 family transposase